MPHKPLGDTPETFLWNPAVIDMWLNDQYGDCVSAEECFAKACNSPEIFISDDTLLAFCQANNLLNGANLIDVIDLMESTGIQQDGQTYKDGAAVSVDWTNRATLTNAISQGPVKIAVAADQLENAVNAGGDKTGWFASGFVQDGNLDHCVSLCGYGQISWLAQQLGATVPYQVTGNDFGYALFTWNSIGIIDEPSMLAITGEAWLRNPTTVIA